MSTVDQLIEFISDELLMGQLDQPLEGDDDLLLSGLVDSLGVMRLMIFLEEDLGIEVPPGDVTIDNFRTPQTIAQYVDTHRVAVS